MQATVTLIHRANFAHNIACIRACAPDQPICLALKANAYGHGAVLMAKLALDLGVKSFGLARVEEGLALRQAGIEASLLLYGLADPREYEAGILANLEFFVVSIDQAQALAAAGRDLGHVAKVHIKVDAGMGRIGCQPHETLALAQAIQASPSLHLAGIGTHFPLADNPDQTFTRGQIATFKQVLGQVRAAGIDPGLAHAANSPGLSRFPESLFDMVRPGIMAYGYNPGVTEGPGSQVKPVMELQTRLTQVKTIAKGTPLSYGHTWTAPETTRVATIPVGYADGLPRQLSNRMEVVIDGQSYPQVGTITMDQCLINLGPDSSLKEGDLVTVFGPGAETAQTLADRSGTIPYAITSGIAARVPRLSV